MTEKKLSNYMVGIVLACTIVGAGLFFRSQQPHAPVDAKVTAVSATADIPSGETIKADEVQQTIVPLVAIPSDFVSKHHADGAATIAGKTLPYYVTQKEDAVGWVSKGISKGQVIVHRLDDGTALGGATLNEPKQDAVPQGPQ